MSTPAETICQGCEDAVAARMQDSQDVMSFFLELKNLLDKLLRFRSGTCMQAPDAHSSCMSYQILADDAIQEQHQIGF